MEDVQEAVCECGSHVQRVFDDDEQRRTIFECENCGEILETVYWDDES